MFIKSFSGKILVLLVLIFSIQFSQKLDKVISDQSTCICSFDGFGYYMYLPHFINEGSLEFEQSWAEGIQNKYCDSNLVYQLQPSKHGGILNVYHMGLAFVQLPAYLIGDLSARIGGYETDGFSKPYYIAYLLNALLFIVLGLIYFRKLLKLFFNDRTAGITMLLIYLGSNLYITFTMQYDLAHLYLFALNAVFLYFFFRYTNSQNKKHLLISAAIFGLTICIRPTQAIWGIIPLCILLKNNSSKLKTWLRLLWFPAFAILWNIPQFIYWYTIGGSLIIPNLHTEEIIIIDPKTLDFLFSYKKGWLLYSPLFILIIFGFVYLYKNYRRFFWAFFGFTALYIYIMSSWECWWYASSFGSRVMVDIYPLLGLLIAYAFLLSKSMIYRIFIGAFATLCLALSLFQSYQFEKYLIHDSRMTKQHYWYMFGKIDAGNYTDIHLEIDRENPNWVERKQEYIDHGYEFHTRVIMDKPAVQTAVPYNDYRYDKITLLELVPNDETCFDVTFKIKTSDSTKSSIIRFETVSKFNCYSWDNLEVSLNRPQGEFQTYTMRFNLKHIRHSIDQMQIYIDNEEDVEVQIKDLKITATTLIRK